MDDDDKKTLDRLRYLMHGNGHPPLEQWITRIDNLGDRTGVIERALFYNPDTKEDGVVADVRSVKQDMSDFKSGFKAVKWTLVVGVPALAVLLGLILSALERIA